MFAAPVVAFGGREGVAIGVGGRPAHDEVSGAREQLRRHDEVGIGSFPIGGQGVSVAIEQLHFG